MKMESDLATTKHTFWTGGWDSTFLVLRNLELGFRVQPHYILDHERASLDIELQTIAALRARIEDELGDDFSSRLLPTIFVKRDEVAANSAVQEDLEVLRRTTHIGTQYDWLTEYGYMHKDLGLEVGQQSKDGALARLLMKELTDSVNGFGLPEVTENVELRAFRYFTYPLLNWGMTKVNMQDYASQKGWSQIMNATYFCHHPRRTGRPCGRCSPCVIAVAEGMGHRVPWDSRILRQLSRVNVWRKKFI